MMATSLTVETRGQLEVQIATVLYVAPGVALDQGRANDVVARIITAIEPVLDTIRDEGYQAAVSEWATE